MEISKVKTPEMEKTIRNQMKTLFGGLQSTLDTTGERTHEFEDGSIERN